MPNRRSFLQIVATSSLLAIAPRVFAQNSKVATSRLAEIETKFDARLGLFALDTESGARIQYRAGERFPLLSTFKVMAAAAILKRSEREPNLLNQRVRYNKSNLVTYSPITEKHVADGMTIGELCAAAIQYSDNTAGNLLLRLLGGPQALTRFARSTGNNDFRLDRWETALNSAIPGDPRDTATPEAMARSLRDFTLGNALSASSKAQLIEWLVGNTTGDKRIRAAVPSNWRVGDKTGSGDYGSANDIAIIFPPDRAPIILAIYTTHTRTDAKRSDASIVEAARIASANLSAR